MKAILKTAVMGNGPGYQPGSTIDTELENCPISEAELRQLIDLGQATPVNDGPEVPEKRGHKEKRTV